MTFWQGLIFVHRESWAFVLLCPFIVAIPVVAEFVQHVVEMRIGLYEGVEQAQGAESNSARLAFGFIKTLAISAIGYSVIRFLRGGRDRVAASTLESRAAGLFAAVFALQALLSYLSLYVFAGEGPVVIGFFVFGLLLSPLLARFVVGAPLGVLIAPPASIKQMWRQLPWALAFNLVAALPLMALHYALSIGAIYVADERVQWIMLSLDSLVVGWLAALLAAVTWVIAVRKDAPGSIQPVP